MAVFSVPIGHGASFRHMPRWHAMVGSPASEVGVVFMRLGWGDRDETNTDQKLPSYTL